MLRTKIAQSVAAIENLALVESQLGLARDLLAETVKSGRVVLTLGNGGSAAEAQHFVAELVGRFKTNRVPYPAVALTADSATLTAIANDFGYEEVFARQVSAYSVPGDLIVAFSTSGNSRNVVKALKTALAQGCKSVAFLGGDGGRCKDLATVSVVVPATDVPSIQEAHLVCIHWLCEQVVP
jgi:D-sedoheptulose 7-phosphate isomerase